MKKLFVLLCLPLVFGCDDGNIEIEAIDFETGDPQFCGSLSVTTANVLFKTNGDEALIVELPTGALKNEVSDGALSFTVPTNVKVTYRLFSDNVTSTYFCNAVPLTEPTVVDEIAAVDGIVYITTTTEDSITYNHAIELSGISLVTSTNTRITDLRINNFGDVTTTSE